MVISISYNTRYLSDPSVDYPYSFVIFQVGSTYYAQSTYGKLSYSGLNATIVIQSAITWVGVNGGGEIFFRAGIYWISGTLIIVYENIALCGEGRWNTIIKLADNRNVNMIYLSPDVSSNFYIHDLCLDGNLGHNAGNKNYGIYADNARYRLNLNSVRFQYIYRSCLYMYNMDTVYIINCDFYYSASYSDDALITLDGGTHFVWITSCDLVGGQRGIYFKNAGITFVHDCNIEQQAHFGIFATIMMNSEISGCYFDQEPQKSIEAYGSATRFNQFINNRFYNCLGIVIELDSYATDNVVAGNTIKNTNSIGILIDNHANRNTITDNIIIDDRGTPLMTYGIREFDNSDYNIVIGNIAKGATVSNITTTGSHTINEHNQSS
jgi:hypothetical protein